MGCLEVAVVATFITLLVLKLAVEGVAISWLGVFAPFIVYAIIFFFIIYFSD